MEIGEHGVAGEIALELVVREHQHSHAFDPATILRLPMGELHASGPHQKTKHAPSWVVLLVKTFVHINVVRNYYLFM